ncbi:MAG: hypothetical protein JNL11_18805 [Bdellovibrionaceae bacterium]|nr:hypothetical protein [Pseudobdellovibrionaceae bacterium]
MQNRLIKILLLLVVSFSKIAWAKDPIYFLPEKNNLQILPQKFEYNLLNKSTIKIGDIVIDSNNLSLELSRDTKGYSFIFNWPAGLFQYAELVLFNNYGKAIKTYTINKDNVELAKEAVEKDSLLRTDKAIFKTNIETVLIEEIKYLPFFKFCIQRQEENTKIDLCSVELYFSSKDGKPTIKMRSDSKKKAQILVNNAHVGEQGIIFLNDLTESIHFRGQSESGARLEIETRLKPVDFKDVVISDDGQSLILTGHGSFPVSDKNVTKLGDSLWQIRLPTDFPVFYIQGEGGIPFRQEFFIRGQLPTEGMRTQALDLVHTTYASSEKMTLELPKGISIISKEANSKVSPVRNQKADWTVSNLEKGENSKRILYLKKDNSEFAVYQSIYRAPAFEARLGLTYFSAEKLSFGNLGLNYWIDKRSGLGLNIDQTLTKSDTIEKWSTNEFSYLHRLNAGLNFQDPSFYVSAHLRSSTIGDFSFSQIGFGIGQKSSFNSSFFLSFADWYNWNFNYYLGAKSSDAEIKSVMQIDYRLYLALSHTYMFQYGFNIQNFSLANMGAMKPTQTNLTLGLTYLF